jgi:diguanylate cyclase (GGDEF)-like protein
MTPNQPALTASTRWLNAWACAALAVCVLAAPSVLCASTAPAPSNDVVDEAVTQLDADRATALAQLRALWADPAQPLRGKAAVALSSALGKGEGRDTLPALVTEMLDSGVLTPTERALVFSNRLSALSEQRQWPEDDAALRAEAEAFSNAAPAGDGRAAPLDAIGAGLLSRGKFPEAEQWFRKALSVYEGSGPTRRRSDYLRNLGVALAQEGKLDQSLEAMLDSQSMREALGLPDSHLLLGNLAGLHLYMERWDRALALAERAIAASPPDSASRTKYINNAGSALFGLGRIDEARVRFEESLALAERLGAPSLSPLNNLAFALLKQGDTREAMRRFEQIEAIATQNHDLALLGVAKKNLGESWIALGDRRRADTFLQAARDIYKESDNRPKAVELYPVLIDNLEALGRHAEALQRMREFKALNDEMNSVASNERIAGLEANAELRHKESELAIQKAGLAAQQADIERLQAQEVSERLKRQLLIGAIVALALILMLLARHVRLRARAHNELLRKNGEIDAHLRDLERLNDVVRKQSEEDALTGLYNRRHLQALLSHRSAHPDMGYPLLAIVADLDHFKRINDAFGHPVGDKALLHVAGVLRRCQRDGDELIRWGGEEFIWLCRGASEAQAPALCARLQQALADHPLEIDGHTITLTVSLGFAPASLWPGREPDVDLAIRLADQAAYCAKAAGRNTWTGYSAGIEPPADVDLARCTAETMEQQGWVRRVAA